MRMMPNLGARVEGPDSDQDIFSFEVSSSCSTVLYRPDESALKSCLPLPTAPKEGHVVWKDKPAQYHSHRRPDSN